ncbi:DUF5325 family protein [Paenibacillus popilliae]|uniref:Uncharacterized protein n=1 Tax=Paenibacillus popilliae TaxID=78057 RepID=A0ABY3AJ07_PAEPP|nr:DUF5325 family protein [Paenibacillus sp. SDF0028]TQR42236.1 hypothetical protein C7Y44_24225 [Paenibacillus sp. SDF0028]
MNKWLSLWFACSSIALLIATAISISQSVWLALLFTILTIVNMGCGFIVKAKLRRRSLAQQDHTSGQ